MCIHDRTTGDPWDFCAQGVPCLGHTFRMANGNYGALEHPCSNQCRKGVQTFADALVSAIQGGEGQ